MKLRQKEFFTERKRERHLENKRKTVKWVKKILKNPSASWNKGCLHPSLKPSPSSVCASRRYSKTEQMPQLPRKRVLKGTHSAKRSVFLSFSNKCRWAFLSTLDTEETTSLCLTWLWRGFLGYTSALKCMFFIIQSPKLTITPVV